MFYEAYLLKQVKYNLSLFVIPAAMALLVQPFKCASVMAHFLLTRFSKSEQSNLPLPAPGQSSLFDHPVFTLLVKATQRPRQILPLLTLALAQCFI